MKKWYLIIDGKETECSMVSVCVGARTIVFDYLGTNVKVFIKEFNKNYTHAKDGIPADAEAVSPLRTIRRDIKIVFK